MSYWTSARTRTAGGPAHVTITTGARPGAAPKLTDSDVMAL
jgi:hypothetical protein